jgi:subtilase family serine protease
MNRSAYQKPEVLDGPDYVIRAKAKNAWAQAATEFDANLDYGSPPF